MNFTKPCGWIPTTLLRPMPIWGGRSLNGKPRESIPEFEAALNLNPDFKAGPTVCVRRGRN